MDSTFITVAIIGTLAVISPGPDFLVVTRNSLLYSKRVGLATALGIALGNIWWIAASILGISVLISQTVILFNLLKWLGVAYLLYLGIKSILAKKAAEESPTTTPRASKNLGWYQGFRIGFLTNVLNPKCALFFVSFFSVVITPDTPVFLQWTYGLEIMTIAVIWFSLLATVLSLPKIQQGFQRISLWFERVTGALLLALGIKLALYER